MEWDLTPIQLAHLLGQCEHETGGFNIWEENLNYSSLGLLNVFPKYYPDKLLAIKHERKPSLIANHVYGGRMGNNQPNDGWHFKGRGAIQLTGRTNYRLFSEYLKDGGEIMVSPQMVAHAYAFDSALWYFKERNLFNKCIDLSEQTITAVSKVVNGGINGLQDRITKTKQYEKFI